MKLPLEKEMYSMKKVQVHGNTIQTYSFGTGPKKILSFPAYPHSGLIYLYYLYTYDLSKVSVLTFDLPGWIGNSRMSPENMHYDEEFLLEVADKLTDIFEYDKYSVMGYSFGTSLSVRHSAKHIDRVNKVALISPLLNGPRTKPYTYHPYLLRAVNSIGAPWMIKKYVENRFLRYKKYLVGQPIISDFLEDYYDLIKKSDSRILCESINHLFGTDYSEYIRQIPSEKLIIVNSKNEPEYFRKQAEYLRRILAGENSIFIEGAHEDFVLKPNEAKAKEILDLLTH